MAEAPLRIQSLPRHGKESAVTTMTISPRTLIEALLPFDEPMSLEKVYAAAQSIGLQDQPVRLTLRRLISAAEITQHGRGRNGTITLTDKGRQRLSRDRIGLHLAYAQDAGVAPWNGVWHLYALSSPEHDRSIRDSFRRDVQALGAKPISTGLYLSPHEISSYFSIDTKPYLVTATATQLTVRGLGDQKVITEELWPAAGTIQRYQELSKILDTDFEAINPLHQQVLLAEALETALRNDPLIPEELRQTPWLPTKIRQKWLTKWTNANPTESDLQIYQGWLGE